VKNRKLILVHCDTAKINYVYQTTNINVHCLQITNLSADLFLKMQEASIYITISIFNV